MEEVVNNYLLSKPEELLMVVISAVVIYFSVIMFTKIFGLRSFSTMSSFDFAMTVAVGSLIASVVIATTSLFNGVIGLLTIYLLQLTVALFRRKTGLQKVLDNSPMLLMWNGKVLEENIKEVRVTRNDIRSKLRENNIFSYNEVKAMIMETTGDISVIHSPDPRDFDDDLLKNVKGLPEEV